IELLAYFGVRVARCDQEQNLALPLGELGESRLVARPGPCLGEALEQLAGGGGAEQGVAGGDDSDGVDQLVGLDVFEQEACADCLYLVYILSMLTSRGR